jgi:ureidoglycolate lyase
MKKIKVQQLTEEAFRPFGLVIGTEGRPYGGEEGVYRWYEKQAEVDHAETVSVNLLTVIHRPFTCRRFEAHQRTTETILPLTGGLIVAGIPEGEADMKRLAAFYVPVGMGICWAKGAWHYAPYPLYQDETCTVIFRHGTGGDDAVFADLPEDIGFEL